MGLKHCLRVFGIPEGQERPRWGNGHFFSPKSAWWKAVSMQALIIHPPRLMDGPIAIHVIYYFPRPKASPAWTIWCPQKPDVDNVDKATFDAMTGTREKPGRWWTDDKQIVHCLTEKRYCAAGSAPGAAIWVREIPHETQQEKRGYDHDIDED